MPKKQFTIFSNSSKLIQSSRQPTLIRQTHPNESGQGLIEYLILTAIIAVAAIGIVRVLGQTVDVQFANITFALQGEQKKVEANKVQDAYYKKRDLGDFFNGAAKDDK